MRSADEFLRSSLERYHDVIVWIAKYEFSSHTFNHHNLREKRRVTYVPYRTVRRVGRYNIISTYINRVLLVRTPSVNSEQRGALALCNTLVLHDARLATIYSVHLSRLRISGIARLGLSSILSRQRTWTIPRCIRRWRNHHRGEVSSTSATGSAC
jgi:hypothetical protein